MADKANKEKMSQAERNKARAEITRRQSEMLEMFGRDFGLSNLRAPIDAQRLITLLDIADRAEALKKRLAMAIEALEYIRDADDAPHIVAKNALAEIAALTPEENK